MLAYKFMLVTHGMGKIFHHIAVKDKTSYRLDGNSVLYLSSSEKYYNAGADIKSFKESKKKK